MRKPLIGIVPLEDQERDSYWMLPGYMEGIAMAGGIPVMLPLTGQREVIAQLAQELDGFLLTGGQDVSPELYGEERLPVCGQCSEKRDEMEQILLEEVLKRDKPILGICRGIQFLNAAQGGTLYQDLPSQRPSETEHHQSQPYDRPTHLVTVLENTPLAELLGSGELAVNSYHHQAIKDLAPGLKPMARSEDGLVEAVWLPGQKFVWALQWHPEFSYKVSGESRKIFEQFISQTL